MIKVTSNYHANLCIARGILYLIVTGCSFIPIPFQIDINNEETTIPFAIVVLLIIAISYYTTIQKNDKNLNILNVLGISFYILYTIGFVFFIHSFIHLSLVHVNEMMHYAFICPCVLDLFCGILYKFCQIQKHYIVYLPFLISVWIVYLVLSQTTNINLEELAILFGVYSFTIITRTFTAYRISSNTDNRLSSLFFGTCLFLAFHFILPMAYVVVAVLLVRFMIKFFIWMFKIFYDIWTKKPVYDKVIIYY